MFEVSLLSEQKVINYLYAPCLFQTEVHENKAINAFCLKYLVQQRWPDQEALLAPSTLRDCVTISDSSAAQIPPGLQLIIFQLTVKLIGRLRYIKMDLPFQIHGVFIGAQCFAESLEQTLTALGSEGSTSCSSGAWCQNFGMFPSTPPS